MLTAGVSSQERQRRYLSLSPWDKATLSLVRPALGLRSSLNPRDLCCLILLFVSARVVRFSPTRWRGPLLSSTPCSCTVWCSWYVRLHVSTCLLPHLSSKISPVLLRSSFRCYTRPHGARALAETAPLSVLKSELIRPAIHQSLFCSPCSVCMVPTPPLLLCSQQVC